MKLNIGQRLRMVFAGLWILGYLATFLETHGTWTSIWDLYRAMLILVGVPAGVYAGFWLLLVKMKDRWKLQLLLSPTLALGSFAIAPLLWGNADPIWVLLMFQAAFAVVTGIVLFILGDSLDHRN